MARGLGGHGSGPRAQLRRHRLARAGIVTAALPGRHRVHRVQPADADRSRRGRPQRPSRARVIGVARQRGRRTRCGGRPRSPAQPRPGPGPGWLTHVRAGRDRHLSDERPAPRGRRHRDRHGARSARGAALGPAGPRVRRLRRHRCRVRVAAQRRVVRARQPARRRVGDRSGPHGDECRSGGAKEPHRPRAEDGRRDPDDRPGRVHGGDPRGPHRARGRHARPAVDGRRRARRDHAARGHRPHAAGVRAARPDGASAPTGVRHRPPHRAPEPARAGHRGASAPR